jgi:hypothetical protein
MVLFIALLVFAMPCSSSLHDSGTKSCLEKDTSDKPVDYQTTSKQKLMNSTLRKDHLSFAAFADTHIGARYQYPCYRMADHLDKLGEDLINATPLLDFAIHLGDIVNHNTAQVHGKELPWFVNQYKNNLKAFLISHVNLPFHCVIGNHDVNDYEMNADDPHSLTKALINELSMNTPLYAMMRDGILFLVVPELGYVQWTHPVEYEWIDYMISQYPETTTVILSHQAIVDTTKTDDPSPYRGKQDIKWWTTLFQKNPQIKLWIHGHNHCLDWYVGNQSTGTTKPIQNFGHEIAFSAPYAQLDWGKYHEEDRIVIYTISSTGISTTAWENNGFGGHYVSEYTHSWTVNTTYDPTVQDWYSFPTFLQDNETQLTDMKVVSSNISLQLIGTSPMELFYDASMQSPPGKPHEKILGFGNDQSNRVKWTDPGMQVDGPAMITFPEKYPHDGNHEDGRSGQPYHSFPMGTIGAAIPGQTYQFTLTAQSASGHGRIALKASCCDWSTRTQYSVLLNSERLVLSHTFGTSYETIHGSYTVPNNQNAWFLQGIVEFLDATTYDISLFSITRQQSSNTTENFHLCLSGTWYNTSGMLHKYETDTFPVTPEKLGTDGVMNFTANIDGNHYGMVNLIYHEPLLLSRNARFRVNKVDNGIFNISLITTISQYSSAIANQCPSTPSLKNVLLENNKQWCLPGLLLILFMLLMFLRSSACRFPPLLFELYPFSTDPIYTSLEIEADDGSGTKHKSSNGNLWLSCTLPKSTERLIKIALNPQ